MLISYLLCSFNMFVFIILETIEEDITRYNSSESLREQYTTVNNYILFHLKEEWIDHIIASLIFPYTLFILLLKIILELEYNLVS